MKRVEVIVEIDAALFEEALKRGVHLAAATEEGILAALRREEPHRPVGIVRAAEYQKAHPEEAEARAKAWAEKNAEAIDEYRRRIEEHGVFGEDFRTW